MCSSLVYVEEETCLGSATWAQIVWTGSELIKAKKLQTGDLAPRKSSTKVLKIWAAS